MTDGTIHLPAVREPTKRERLTEIRRMIKKIVVLPVVDLKTFKGLRKIEGLMEQQVKIEDSTPPKGPNGPKSGQKRQVSRSIA